MDAQKEQAPDGVRAALQMRDSYDERNRLQDVEAPSLNFQDYIFDTTTEPEPPDYLLEINGVGVMPRGGLTVVSGEKKNGKTSFLTAMVATMMSGRDFGTMRRRTAPGKILWIDTEQSSNEPPGTIQAAALHQGVCKKGCRRRLHTDASARV